MSDVQARLTRCFAAVFPHLSAETIQLATPNTVEAWDSLASITLISVIEEEFEIEIDPEDIEHLVSFERVLEYVSRKALALPSA
jgi:acyl carrier protein